MSNIAARAASLVNGTLADARRLSGGSLSEVVRLRLADGRDLVAKSFRPESIVQPAGEAEMLRALAEAGVPTPEVVAVGDDLLVMAAVPADGRLSGRVWTRLADILAKLHTPSNERFGWPRSHAFGNIVINNERNVDWPIFWGEQRLACHLPFLELDLAQRLERLLSGLDAHLPEAPRTALLHGDLWGGNVLVSSGQVTALIDPACYYGDPEVDIAMLTLFDNPPQSFFDSLALEPGWRKRLPLYRLWPLLVHLRLFGAGYREPVEDALNQLGV
jgi:fructosamine-3-kinase